MDESERGLEQVHLVDIETAISTLRDDALPDFLHEEALRRAPDRRSLLSFDCFFRDGRIEPIDPATRAFPLFAAIGDALAADPGANALMLPDHLVIVGRYDDNAKVRLLVVGDDIFAELLAGLTVNATIPKSEVRLGKQLVCGMTLPQAAAVDGVSHETKRSQYKRLARKTDVRSQNDLVARVLTQLVVDAGRSGAARGAGVRQELAELVHAYIPAARVYTISDADGTQDSHVIEVGPQDGKPFLMIHSQVLPDFGEDEIAALHESGRRIVIPLRNGALAPDAVPLDLASHMDHACLSIARTIDRLGLDKVPVMACISGCAYALEFASRMPYRVASLALVGACVRPNTGSSTAGRLRSGLLSLAMRNWTLYSKVIAFYGRRIRRPETCRQLLLNVYRPCRADLDVIEAEYRPPYHGERLRRFFCGSVESIKHDFYHQAFPRWDRVAELSMPLTFLHGTSDFIHTIEHVRDLAAGYGRSVLPIAGGGQLLYHRHFRPMLEAYVAFVDEAADGAG